MKINIIFASNYAYNVHFGEILIVVSLAYQARIHSRSNQFLFEFNFRILLNFMQNIRENGQTNH